MLRAFVRAGAAGRWRLLYVSELQAGAALRLAGFSSGRGVCARGAGRRGVGEGRKLPDFAMPCRRENPFDLAALDISPFKEGVAAGGGGGVLRMAFMSQFAVFYISFGTHTGHAFLLERFMLVSRLLFAAERQTGRLAICFVSIPRGSGSPLVRSHDSVRLSDLAGSLWNCAFLCGDSDGG